MKKIVLACFLTTVLVACSIITGIGYLLGNYFVHFGLERGTAENPQEPPRAYALLMPPEAREFERPDYPAETWSLAAADGLNLSATHFAPRRERGPRRAFSSRGVGAQPQSSADPASSVTTFRLSSCPRYHRRAR